MTNFMYEMPLQGIMVLIFIKSVSNHDSLQPYSDFHRGNEWAISQSEAVSTVIIFCDIMVTWPNLGTVNTKLYLSCVLQ